jgi:hypothetical protein
MNASKNPYSGHRYTAEIVSHAVWLYFRFALKRKRGQNTVPASISKNCALTPVFRRALTPVFRRFSELLIRL